MKVTWLGHACFKLEQDDFVVILDPYSAGSVPGYKPLDESADLVLSSHGHGDHNAVTEIHLTSGKEDPFTIDTIDTFHDPEEGKLRGTNRITIMEAGGITAVHMGDIGCALSDEEYEEIGHPDVLMIPVGGHFTVEPDVAAAMAKRIDAKVSIPMHFRSETFGYPVIATNEAFLAQMENVKKYEGAELEVTGETEKQVAVLTPKYA